MLMIIPSLVYSVSLVQQCSLNLKVHVHRMLSTCHRVNLFFVGGRPVYGWLRVLKIPSSKRSRNECLFVMLVFLLLY